MKRLSARTRLRRTQLATVVLALALVTTALVAGYWRGQLTTTRADLKALGDWAYECAQANPCWGH